MLSLKLMTVYSSPWNLQLKINTWSNYCCYKSTGIGQVLLDQLLH